MATQRDAEAIESTTDILVLAEEKRRSIRGREGDEEREREVTDELLESVSTQARTHVAQ